ncbi:CLCA_X family protein [Ferrimonas senticii]|uniref:CLCA_X family protein n=1 Tax=Ferrimonas senticii TaxID=394566 RepID=UPI00042360E8|nr:CLCA_X family protein [Ferrimonas senticii]
MNGALHRDYRRYGPDYRCGEQVDFADIKAQFGLAGIVVGRWVDKQEKALAANLVFDALADLAFLLNLPPQAMGLRQTLSLAFGHGGSPVAQAHYAPASNTLALAKNAGAGALAHEWWHAFDHYIAFRLFKRDSHDSIINSFASNLWLAQRQAIEHPLNQRLEQLLATVLLSADGADQSEYVRRSVALDKQFGRRYLSLPTEMLARAFEAAIQGDDRIHNPYLVSGTKATELAKLGGFPDRHHLGLISTALHGYFTPLGQALSR